MKTGKSLIELATEITRRAEAKKDFIVDTSAAQMVVGPFEADNIARPALTFGDKTVAINGIAHDQIGTHVGIPAKYYDRMKKEAPDLLVTNVNRWFEKYPSKQMVRTLDNTARAFLSDRYRPLENEDLANAVLPVLGDMGVDIMSMDITDRNFYVKAVDRRITKDVPAGKKMGDASHTFFDTLSPAIVISNSEVGLGALSVKTSIFTKVCTNLATIDKAGSLRKYHVGARQEIGEDVYALLSDTSRKLDDAALWSKVRDIVKGAFEAARFEAIVNDKILGMTEQAIKGNPVEAVNLASRRFGITDGEKISVLRHLVEGGDLTRYGLFNAVTRTAEDLDDYDRATAFEAMGWEIIELGKADWQVIAEAA